MIIGSHVAMKAPLFVEGSVLEALSYGANALMIYTGAPQNTRRQAIENIHIEEARALLKENNIPMEHVIVHAPYIINLANTINPSTYELAVSFLREELNRVEAIGAHYVVLHPGSHVKAGRDLGIDQIVKGLNEVLTKEQKVYVALETMAGKGSEIGCTFEDIAYINEHVVLNDKLKVCMDTCHIHDAGYDLNNFDQVLDEFDRIVGLDRLVVMHLNDSKNVNGARKDRHANLGHGEIGFELLSSIASNPRLDHVVKILETPYVEGKAPYKQEIQMLRDQEFTNILPQEEV